MKLSRRSLISNDDFYLIRDTIIEKLMFKEINLQTSILQKRFEKRNYNLGNDLFEFLLNIFYYII